MMELISFRLPVLSTKPQLQSGFWQKITTFDDIITVHDNIVIQQGPVVQSIISLNNDIVKTTCYMPTYANTPLFFVEKMWKSFALQKILTFLQQKISVFVILKFEILTKH